MALWNKLRPSAAVAVNKGPGPEELKSLLGRMGVNVIVTPEGEVVPVPADAAESDVKSFVERWSGASNSKEPTPENRDTRLRTYSQMDVAGGEPAIVLDTYADEVVNVVDSSQQSLEIRIDSPDGKELTQKVMHVLQRCRVLDNMRSDIRDLCQYGDFAYSLTDNAGKPLLDLSTEEARAGNSANVVHTPEEIMVRHHSAAEYELESDSLDAYRLNLVRDSRARSAIGSRAKGVNPWEFSLFRLNARKTDPYGMSILERMRQPWEKLTLLEELLAITRANRLDRIAFTVPGVKGDPMSVLARLSGLKNSIKSLILGSGGSSISRNQDTGMTEWLWLPEGYKAERLSTSIEVSSIEDVEYFRDKVINASRLPKGFFLASEGGSTPRPMSLRQQDIKFARSLMPIGEAYCHGLDRLILLICFYLGAQIGRVQVRTRFKSSPYLSDELLTTYSNIYDIVDRFKTLRSSFQQASTITDLDVKRILDLVGAPHTLLFPPEGQQRESLNESQKTLRSLYDVARI